MGGAVQVGGACGRWGWVEPEGRALGLGKGQGRGRGWVLQGAGQGSSGGVANMLVQEVPGGRALVTRRPLGVVGVAWSGPRPLWHALELLPPALAFGNGLVVAAPPSGIGPALRLRQALVAAGLPGGALTVLPGGAGGDGATLARHHPDGLWLCGGGTDPDWASAGSVAHVWVPRGVLGGPGQEPPPGAERELELRCTHPHCLWVPGGGA
ncbi:aldehyde dehydrogenase family 16 member A1-like [Sarcoramphus papa]